MKLTTAALAIIATLIIASAASATIVTNGGFETGNFTGWTLGGACPAPGPNPGAAPCFSHVTDSSLPELIYGVFDGTYSGRFGAQPDPATLTQLITAPAGNYDLSFFLALTTGDPPGNGVFSPPNLIHIFFGGSEVGSLENLNAHGWIQYAFPITSTGLATNLEFDFRQDL